MEIVSIQLYNFRQFEAIDNLPQTIKFSASRDKNVTAVYGTNGAGKSGLLNAFTWVLFGRTTGALKHPSNLVNQHALSVARPGDRVTCRVVLEFRAWRDGRSILHTLERSSEATAGSDNGSSDAASGIAPKGRPILRFAVPGGGAQVLDNPDEIDAYINRILPADLFQYFFIDGERIANLAKPENESEVQRAVEVFVGLQDLRDSAAHLDQAADEFLRQVKDADKSNIELNRILDDIDALEDTIKSKSIQLAEKTETIKEITIEINRINHELEQNKETQSLEEMRTSLLKQKGTYETQIGNLQAQTFRRTMTHGWAAFALDSAVSHLESDVNLRKNRDIPYRIRREVILELLERLRCLCGRTLNPAEADELERPAIELAVAELKRELERADFSEVQEFLFNATACARDTSRHREDLAAELSSLGNQVADLRSLLEPIVAKIADINLKLGGTQNVELSDMVKRRDTLELRKHEYNDQCAIIRSKVEEDEEDLKNLREQSAKVASKTKEGRLAQRRQLLCRQTASAVLKFYDIQRKIVRHTLEEKVRKFFRDYSITSYIPRVSDSYALSLYKRYGDGEEFLVPDSTGEGQALSLAFITAVASYAMELRSIPAFPIVIDSQFGSLDKVYHVRIGKVLPSHVGQVVMVQTKTQWTQEMTDAIHDRVGAEVVLTRRVLSTTPEQQLQESGTTLKLDETITLSTGSYPYIEVADTDSTLAREILR